MPYPSKTSPDAILEAALELLEQEGEEALSMRNLADKLGLKAPSLYRHYEGREALEIALVQRGNAMLQEALEAATHRRSPKAKVMAAAQVYIAFAREHPQLYQLMMDTRLAAPTYGTGKELWNTVLRLVGGVTGDSDDTAATVAFWAFVHGYAELERSGLFGASGPKGGFEVGLAALLEGFEARAG